MEAARLHVSDEFGQIDVSLEARSACFTSDQTGGGGGTVDVGGGGWVGGRQGQTSHRSIHLLR